MGLVRFTSEELQLIKEYGQIRRRAAAIEATIPDGIVDISLDPEERPVLARVPSGKECREAWAARYPRLASMAVLLKRIPDLRDQLLAGLAQLPAPPRNRRVTPEELREVRDQIETARRAVSLWARYLLALEALRSVVSARTRETVVTPFDRLQVGREVMYHPTYRNYDRWRLRLARTRSRVKEMNGEYEAERRQRPQRKEYLKEYMRRYRKAAR